MSDINLPEGRTIKEQLDILQKQGYSRVEINDTIYRISELNEAQIKEGTTTQIILVVDRFAVADDEDTKPIGRLHPDRLWEGDGASCLVKMFKDDGTKEIKQFSIKFEGRRHEL